MSDLKPGGDAALRAVMWTQRWRADDLWASFVFRAYFDTEELRAARAMVLDHLDADPGDVGFNRALGFLDALQGNTSNERQD